MTPKLTAKWTKFESKMVDTWQTRYVPRRPIKLPISNDAFKRVVKRLKERFFGHITKFAFIRMKMLIEEGLYHTTFDIDEASGLAIQYVNTRTIPRWAGAKFTTKDLFIELRRQLASVEEVVVSQEKQAFIVHFDLVTHNGFWEKAAKEAHEREQNRLKGDPSSLFKGRRRRVTRKV